ncbi:MAG: L-2-hydroxyglutarate oxidase [Planctomycetota bacterium]|nr:L-2-hydroxyglutarate oxidase [Planctomycetota bacterium]
MIGGGIVGLAVARELLERTQHARVTLFEKEAAVAHHQTGRNSGVVHSGLYYAPRSLKALLCVRGRSLLEDYCALNGLQHHRCGKLVVAAADHERARLHSLRERAATNGVDCTLLDARGLRSFEPNVTGVAALHVPASGIVDYRAVAEHVAAWLVAHERGALHLSSPVHQLRPANDVVHLTAESHPDSTFDLVVNCAGLQSDRIARLAKSCTPARIVPFRGEYFRLTAEAQHLVRGLVYPVPDPRFPFLGAHFTRTIDGGVECGPNAVFALSREGYRWRDVSPRDLAGALSYPGTLRLFAKHWRTGVGETWRSLSKPAFVRALQRLVPAIRSKHLVRAQAGVRAQALTRDGALVDDFVVQRDGPLLHVLNAPSPAATAAFAIAEEIVGKHVLPSEASRPLS